MDEVRLSVKQMKEMRHAIGGTFADKPHRNYFNTGKECDSWNELVEDGFAVKTDRKEFGGITYFVTEKGIKALKHILVY